MIAVAKRIDPKEAEQSAELGARRVRVQDGTAQHITDGLREALAEQEPEQEQEGDER